MVHFNNIAFSISIAIVVCVLILVLIFMKKSLKIHKGNLSKTLRARFSSNEANCEFVSTRGLLHLWGISPPNPQSDKKEVYKCNWKKIKPYSIVYITGSSVYSFIKKSLPNITVPFVLVTGDSDASIPIHVLSRADFNKFINDPRVVHWFSQNLVVKHPKLSIIPIGLNYHHTLTKGNRSSWGSFATPLEQESFLKFTRKESLPLAQRQIKCYSNFHFSMNAHYGHDRVEAIKKIPKHLVYYEPHPTTRLEAWKRQVQYAFVISPNGSGYDCYRTWEALLLGCIPVMKRCPISTLNLFEGLPVLLVDDWSDVNLDLLKQTVSFVTKNTWNLEKLTLNYWKQKIMEYKYKFIE